MSILIRFSPKKITLNHLPLKTSFHLCRNLSQQKQNTADASKSPKSQQHYDIIIAGGGLVGTALACGISKNKILSEKRVLLLEGAPPFKGFTGGQYGNRVSAINNSSIELFQTIGAWEKIASSRYKPVKQMQVWDASSDAMITFNHDNFSENVACIIENDLMLDAIYSQLKPAQNVTVLNQSLIENVDLRMEGMLRNIVSLKNGDTISCDLLTYPGGRKFSALIMYDEKCFDVVFLSRNTKNHYGLGEIVFTKKLMLQVESKIVPTLLMQQTADGSVRCYRLDDGRLKSSELSSEQTL